MLDGKITLAILRTEAYRGRALWISKTGIIYIFLFFIFLLNRMSTNSLIRLTFKDCCKLIWAPFMKQNRNGFRSELFNYSLYFYCVFWGKNGIIPIRIHFDFVSK